MCQADRFRSPRNLGQLLQNRDVSLPPLLLPNHLHLVRRISLDLLLGKGQHCPLLRRKRLGLVASMGSARFGRLRRRQQPYGLRPLLIEADHLQVAGAADDFTLAIAARYHLHGVVNAQRTRPAMNRCLLGA